MKLSKIFQNLILGVGITLAGNVLAQDAQIAFYNGNDLMNTNLKKHSTKNIGKNLRYEQDDFVKIDKIALFPKDISAELSIPKDWVFFQGLKSPYSNTWIYMERTQIGTEFSLWFYDADTHQKTLLLNQKTTPKENYSFKPIAWSADKSAFYLEMLKFDTDFDHEGIWKYDLKTKQMSKLSISKDYFTTPMLSPDRNYFLYLNSNEAKRDLLHGYADEIMVYNIEEAKEKSTYKKDKTPLQLAGWVKEKENNDIKVHKISPNETKDEHRVSSTIDYFLPWDSGRAYYVSRHGSPAPTGSHSPTGSRTSIYDGIGQHGYAAVDFDTPDNADQNLRAAAAGTVTSAGDCGCGYGNLVIVQHSDGTRTYYAHMKQVLTSSGQSVSQGAVLGIEGTTGTSTGDHLHFEWRAAGGNSPTIGTFSDVGQPRQGYKYTAGTGTPSDTVDPTTSITAPSSATSDFSATFTDADNVAVTGRFYQVLENYASETRANRGNGFYNDNFSTGSLHSDYTVGAGTWTANSSGRLVQSNTTSTNTSLSTFLSQTNGQSYLYNFAAKLNSTTGNRRFGIHIMASQTDSERGNSYLVWFSEDGGSVTIYETINNTLNTRASASITVGTSWADYKVAYSTTTGKIEVFRNDALLTEWTDSSPLTSGSYISLRTNQANVEFDDLKVYKGRSTGVTVTVGNTNGKDLRTNLAATGQVKSIVRDAAGNFSNVANANITIGTPAITDITGNWAENEIRYMLNNGFMSGYADNTFRPNNTTSRAEFATMIAVIIDPSISSDPTVASRSFTDISGHWAEANILKAARAGYLSGYTDGTFRPNDPITRMQVTLSISNGLGVTGGTSTLLNLFTDKNDVPAWATSSVTNGIANRFVANHPDKNYYKPNDNSTRANATVVMYQALRYLNRAPELFNTYIVVPANPASKVAAKSEDKSLQSLVLYPNPLEGNNLKLKFLLEESTPVEIRLYNVLGEEISLLFNEDSKEGMFQEEFDLSKLNLQTGTYILRIISTAQTQTVRFIKN
ncbi:S-layer homology domain-containing protein [Bernardetia sp. Wsw4-3y2]|uniref:S-layer homology domain-containing protein n=1 Tax=Bernardetia sp. Wsw4-3y2 TaxID=3127471 RepID=UPI0030D4D1FD